MGMVVPKKCTGDKKRRFKIHFSNITRTMWQRSNSYIYLQISEIFKAIKAMTASSSY